MKARGPLLLGSLEPDSSGSCIGPSSRPSLLPSTGDGAAWGASGRAHPLLLALSSTLHSNQQEALSGLEASANQDRGLTSNPLGAPHYKPLWESSLPLWTQGIFSTHILVSQFLRGRNRRGSRAKAPQVSECPRLTLPLGPSSLGAHQG